MVLDYVTGVLSTYCEVTPIPERMVSCPPVTLSLPLAPSLGPSSASGGIPTPSLPGELSSQVMSPLAELTSLTRAHN